MVKIYVALIQKGLKTIDDVPENIREEVRVMLCGEDEVVDFVKIDISRGDDVYV